MEVQVSRYHFWAGKGPGGTTARYTEYAPPCDEPEHAICNCTRTVKDRPEGEPYHVSQEITLYTVIDGVEVMARFGFAQTDGEPQPDDNLNFTLWWPRKNPDAPDAYGDKRKLDHAYFWFDKDHCKVEVTGTGGRYVDCTFANIYFGNKVDTSRLLNGLAKSRILDHLNEAPPDIVWLHDCHFGHEAFEYLKETDAELWRYIHQMVLDLRENARKFDDLERPVEDIRAEILESDYIDTLFGLLARAFRAMVPAEAFKTTSVYEIAQRLDSQIYESSEKARRAQHTEPSYTGCEEEVLVH